MAEQIKFRIGDVVFAVGETDDDYSNEIVGEVEGMDTGGYVTVGRERCLVITAGSGGEVAQFEYVSKAEIMGLIKNLVRVHAFMGDQEDEE